jgi:hypothetical protein
MWFTLSLGLHPQNCVSLYYVKTYSSICALSLQISLSFSPPYAPSFRVDLRTQFKILQYRLSIDTILLYTTILTLIIHNDKLKINKNQTTINQHISGPLDLYLYIAMTKPLGFKTLDAKTQGLKP